MGRDFIFCTTIKNHGEIVRVKRYTHTAKQVRNAGF